MSYEYTLEKKALFTEEGTKILIPIRDNVKFLLKTAGAFRAAESWKGVSGEVWTFMAALDYLVEIGEILEISRPQVAGQHRVFVGRYQS